MSPEKIIISDTSALSNLFVVNQIQILRVLYSNIIIPNAVYVELLKFRNYDFKSFINQNSSWIEIQSVKNTDAVKDLTLTLDLGESEAIILAREIKADLLIIDETLGRKIAATHQIKTIGLLGILLIAKKNNLISEVKPILDLLKSKAGFRIKDDLYKRVLKEANE